MKKRLSVIVSIILILIGCSSEKDRVIDELKSEVQETYSVVVFADELPSGVYQSNVSTAISDDSHKINETISAITYKILNEDSAHKYDYKNALELNGFPEIFIFDNKGIVLRTIKIEELEEFFK